MCLDDSDVLDHRVVLVTSDGDVKLSTATRTVDDGRHAVDAFVLARLIVATSLFETLLDLFAAQTGEQARRKGNQRGDDEDADNVEESVELCLTAGAVEQIWGVILHADEITH